MEEPNGPLNYVNHWALMMMGFNIGFWQGYKNPVQAHHGLDRLLVFQDLFFFLKKLKQHHFNNKKL